MVKNIAHRLNNILQIADQWLLYLSLACSVAILFNLGYNTDIETVLVFEHVLRFTFFFFGVIHLIRLILIYSLVENED